MADIAPSRVVGCGWRAPLGATAPALRSSHLFSVVVIGLYTGLGMAAFWPLLPASPHRLPSQIYGDPVQMVWFFGWTAHAVATAHNPFFTMAANVPFGVNMAQETLMPLLGVLFTPLTLLAGPVSSVTVCFVAAMPLSAASAYAVLRRWQVWTPAAALGGLAYGFSPYMVNQGGSHLNLAFVPLPPLIVAALVELLAGPRHPLRWGAALGGLAAAQFLISSEILAITAIVSVAGLVIAGAYCAQRHRAELRAVLGPALKGAGAAVAVAGVLLSYPIWYEFAGPGHYSGPPWPELTGYDAHLLEFVAPSPHQLVRPALAATGSSLYSFSYLADGAYVGVGVLAVVAVLVWLCRRSARIRLAATLGMSSALLSFGSYTYVDGTGSRTSLPFHYLAKLPTVADIVPIRFSFATAACVAAALAFGLDGIRRKAGTGAKPTGRLGTATGWHANVALAAVCVVVGVTWMPVWPFPSESVTTLPSAVTRALPAGDPIVLAYPYPRGGDDTAMLWQAEAGFSFRLIGVYALVPQLDGRAAPQSPLLDPRGVEQFLAAEDVPATTGLSESSLFDMAVQTRDFVARQHVGAVLVSLSAPNAATVAGMFSAALGPPSVTSGGFQLWVTAGNRGSSVR